MQNYNINLSAEEMQVIMLCLRGEYDSVEGAADALHDQLASEGFSPFDNNLKATLVYQD